MKSRRIRWAGHVACMGEMRNACNGFTVEWEVVDWMHLAQNRDQIQALVNTIMNPRVHKRQVLPCLASQKGLYPMEYVISLQGFTKDDP